MRSRLRICGRALSVLAGLLPAACSDSAGPLHVGEIVFVVGGQQRTSIAAVEGLTGRVLARPHPVPANKVAASLSGDRRTLYLLGADRSGRQLTALDTRALTFRWRLALNSPVATHIADGLWIDGTALASSPDGTRLIVGGAFSVDPAHDPSPANEFVAVLDVQTQDVLGKVGPLQVVEGSGLATVPPCAGAPNGFVVGIGTHATSLNDPTARRVSCSRSIPLPSLLLTPPRFQCRVSVPRRIRWCRSWRPPKAASCTLRG